MKRRNLMFLLGRLIIKKMNENNIDEKGFLELCGMSSKKSQSINKLKDWIAGNAFPEKGQINLLSKALEINRPKLKKIIIETKKENLIFIEENKCKTGYGYFPETIENPFEKKDIYYPTQILENLEILLENTDKILEFEKYSGIPIESMGMRGKISLGALLCSWKENLLRLPCTNCKSSLYIFRGVGSPMTGGNSFGGICSNCNKLILTHVFKMRWTDFIRKTKIFRNKYPPVSTTSFWQVIDYLKNIEPVVFIIDSNLNPIVKFNYETKNSEFCSKNKIIFDNKIKPVLNQVELKKKNYGLEIKKEAFPALDNQKNSLLKPFSRYESRIPGLPGGSINRYYDSKGPYCCIYKNVLYVRDNGVTLIADKLIDEKTILDILFKLIY
jgi:hypothetical protein